MFGVEKNEYHLKCGPYYLLTETYPTHCAYTTADNRQKLW